MKIERRKRRSDMRSKAAELYLETAAERARSSAVAVASDDGLLISGAGPSETLEVMAAIAACPDLELGMSLPLGEPMYSDSFELDGMVFHLASLGGSAISTEEIAAAMDRILLS